LLHIPRPDAEVPVQDPKRGPSSLTTNVTFDNQPYDIFRQRVRELFPLSDPSGMTRPLRAVLFPILGTAQEGQADKWGEELGKVATGGSVVVKYTKVEHRKAKPFSERLTLLELRFSPISRCL
jgi:hypothetical protein